MKIEDIEVKGVKRAVSDVRAECADRWVIVLDLHDWSVCEHGLLGISCWRDVWPEWVTIASGNANNGRGHDMISMYDLRQIIAEVIKALSNASADYAKGVRHGDGTEWGETRADYIRTEVYQAITRAEEQHYYRQQMA